MITRSLVQPRRARARRELRHSHAQYCHVSLCGNWLLRRTSRRTTRKYPYPEKPPPTTPKSAPTTIHVGRPNPLTTTYPLRSRPTRAVVASKRIANPTLCMMTPTPISTGATKGDLLLVTDTPALVATTTMANRSPDPRQRQRGHRPFPGAFAVLADHDHGGRRQGGRCRRADPDLRSAKPRPPP